MSIVQKLKAEIIDISKRIDSIQEQCSHPEEAVTKEHGASTGNPYETNEYWTTFECSLCEKRWRMDGSL